MSPRTNTTSKSSHPHKAKKSPVPDHEPRSAHELHQLKKREGGHEGTPKGTGHLTAANLHQLGDDRDERRKHLQETKTIPDSGPHGRVRAAEKYVKEWEGKWKRAERK